MTKQFKIFQVYGTKQVSKSCSTNVSMILTHAYRSYQSTCVVSIAKTFSKGYRKYCCAAHHCSYLIRKMLLQLHTWTPGTTSTDCSLSGIKTTVTKSGKYLDATGLTRRSNYYHHGTYLEVVQRLLTRTYLYSTYVGRSMQSLYVIKKNPKSEFFFWAHKSRMYQVYTARYMKIRVRKLFPPSRAKRSKGLKSLPDSPHSTIPLHNNHQNFAITAAATAIIGAVLAQRDYVRKTNVRHFAPTLALLALFTFAAATCLAISFTFPRDCFFNFVEGIRLDGNSSRRIRRRACPGAI